jgi:hypothetical protein
MNFILLIFTIILTNGLFSIAWASFLLRLDDNDTPLKDILVYSAGLAPGVTAILLGYLLQIVPGKSPEFYVSVVLIFHILLIIYNRAYFKFMLIRFSPLPKTIKIYIKEIIMLLVISARYVSYWTLIALNFLYFKLETNSVRITKQKKLFESSHLKFSNIFSDKRYKVAINVIVLLSAVILIIHWMFNTWRLPIYGHDMVQYAIQGKIFAQDKKIEYKPNLFDEKSYFSYRARHGFSFPLLLTWEHFVGGILGVKQDYYFRSIPGYYWILVVSLVYIWLAKKNKLLSFMWTAIMVLAPGFLRLSISHNIDTFRIFFLSISFIFSLYLVKNGGWKDLILFGIYGGIAMNAHSIGVFLISIFYTVVLIIMRESFKNKILKALILGILLLSFGGLHYLQDIFFGTGWIFTRIPG